MHLGVVWVGLGHTGAGLDAKPCRAPWTRARNATQVGSNAPQRAPNVKRPSPRAFIRQGGLACAFGCGLDGSGPQHWAQLTRWASRRRPKLAPVHSQSTPSTRAWSKSNPTGGYPGPDGTVTALRVEAPDLGHADGDERHAKMPTVRSTLCGGAAAVCMGVFPTVQCR